jgi:hypothetical protein
MTSFTTSLARAWHPLTTPPFTQRLVLIRGRSAVRIYPTFIVTGYYDPGSRPLDPWRTQDGDSLTDLGWVPEEWTYLTEDLLPPIPSTK